MFGIYIWFNNLFFKFSLCNSFRFIGLEILHRELLCATASISHNYDKFVRIKKIVPENDIN